jgi:pyruvate dehydrogenase E1 component alpha subunit
MRNTPPAETRSADEILSWKARDPIARLEKHGLDRGLLTLAEMAAMRERVKSDLDEAVAFAEQSPFPDPKDLLVDMFAD